jgi:hypothetical protein
MNFTANVEMQIITIRKTEVLALENLFAKVHPEIIQNGGDILVAVCHLCFSRFPPALFADYILESTKFTC